MKVSHTRSAWYFFKTVLVRSVLISCVTMTGGVVFLYGQTEQQLQGQMLPYTFLGEKYEPGKNSIKGYLSVPAGNARSLPALILIHEWWGLNDDIKRKADEFAAEGYVAFAVDLYGGRSTTDAGEARKLSAAVRKDVGAAFSNLKSAIAFLKNYPRVDGDRIGSVGWCFGGGWSYQMAKNDLNTKVSVIYYGFFNPSDDLSKMRAEIIGHFAENDRGIKIDSVREFQVKLKTLNGNHEVYIYPNTTHGFASRKGNNPVYKKDAAELAMQRTLAFLKRQL
ncbi:carboxymethylenebutenolidase [Spirochaetota bacterium]|nr:carboxymethylenebutenolidase [Spirochaetota bacterium]